MQPLDLLGNPILINRDQKTSISPALLPLAGVAPVAGVTPLQVYPPNVMGPIPPALEVADLNTSMETPVDITGYGQGALATADAPEGVLMEPQRDDGIFSFLNKPGASDSLVAFGSAMLRGNTFNEGLANAADAVTQVAQRYRPISEVEIDNLIQRATVEQTIRNMGQPQQAVDEQPAPTGPVVNENRPVYGNLPNGPREMFYPATMNGQFGFIQASTNQFVPSIENALRPEDDAAKYNSKNVSAAREAALTEAIEAENNASKFESMALNFDEAGGGAGYIEALKRTSAEVLGVDLMGVNVARKQEVDKFLRTLELNQAQTQRGLGQLTEAERAIIRESLPSIKDDPRAFKRIMYTMAAQSNRAAMLYDRWINDESLQAKYEDPRQFYREWLKSDEGRAYEASVRSDIESKLSASSSSASGSNPELEDALSKY